VNLSCVTLKSVLKTHLIDFCKILVQHIQLKLQVKAHEYSRHAQILTPLNYLP